MSDYDLDTRRMLLKRSNNQCEICKVRNDIGPYPDKKHGKRLFTAENEDGPIVVCGECRDRLNAPKQMELFA